MALSPYIFFYYVAHMTSVVDRMTLVYSKYTGLDPLAVKADINSSKSDRCPVNGAVVRELKALWCQDLVELHCNLHPLDGFAYHIRSDLNKMDADLQQPSTGRGCCATNFLYTLAKLR